MEATAKERANAAREKRIETWKKKKNEGWTKAEESDKIKKFAGQIELMPDYKMAVISDDKVYKYLLDPSRKHSPEFFDVGIRKTMASY